MTISIDMTLLAIAALVIGVAGFFAPRFLGIGAAVALCVFGVFQLFPEVRTELEEAFSTIDREGIRIEEPAADPDPVSPLGDSGRPGVG